MAHTARGGLSRYAVVALHSRGGRLGPTEDVGARLRSRGWRHGLPACAGVRLSQQAVDIVFEGLDDGRGGLAEILLGRQLCPAELFLQRIRPVDEAPVVDRSGWARRDAVHAEVAFVCGNYVVDVVVRHRTLRAGRLTGAATNADLGIDEMLLYQRRGCGR